MFGKKEESSNPFNFGQKEETNNPFSGMMPKQKSKGAQLVDSAKNAVPGFQEEPVCAKCCPKMTFKQRIIGFASCAGLGWLLSFIGTMVLFGGVTNANIRTFVILYVIGNVIALCATGFLLGPRSQCIKMWDPTRRYSTAFYLIMLIIVLAVAVSKQNIWLVLFLLFVEILAAVWYSLSYIPFGRKMAITCMKKTICKPCFDLYEEGKGGSS